MVADKLTKDEAVEAASSRAEDRYVPIVMSVDYLVIWLVNAIRVGIGAVIRETTGDYSGGTRISRE